MPVACRSPSLVEVTDDVIAMCDRCGAAAEARAEQDVQAFRLAVARATKAQGHVFRALGRVMLDPAMADAARRRAVEEADRLVRPRDESSGDVLETRSSSLRPCAPPFLETCPFHSHRTPDPRREAVALWHALKTSQRRSVPHEAPLACVPLQWRPSVVEQEGRIHRHAYALCALWEWRGALRGGHVWVQPRRRYANPDPSLIPTDRWPTLRPAVCQQGRAPAEGAVRLAERGQELVELLPRVDRMRARTGTGTVRMEHGALVVPRLEAEDLPARAEHLQTGLPARRPLVDLPALLIAVDHWTGVRRH
jgi:hypothetical protein